jgi:PAS domain S-box-containing protein
MSSRLEAGQEKFYLDDAADLLVGVDAGRIGVWHWDIAGNTLRWSKNLEEIHNLPSGSFDGSFSFFEKDIHADDRAAVQAAIQAVQRTGGRYSVRYRIPPRETGDEERWVEARGKAIIEDGVVTRMLGVCQDVTDIVRVHDELLRRARQQEVVADLGWEALTEPDVEKMLQKSVQSVHRELSVELVKVLELVPGDKEMLLRAGIGWKPGLVGKRYIPTEIASQGGYSLAMGKPVIVEDLREETRFGGAELLRDHGVISGISVIIAGRNGRAYGVLGAHSRTQRKFTDRDVAFIEAVANVIAAAIQQRLADSRQNLLISELRHHSGNLFAQLLALFSQTAKTSRNMAELTSKYEARVLAFANAHKLVAEGGWRSTIMQVLRILLAPYVDKVTFNGPDFAIEPDVAFGLTSALHELAMNAVRYGSLSIPAGRVELSWSIQRTEAGRELRLDWIESGGPAVRRPRKLGFGSKLLKAMIERQLNGTVEQLFRPDGVRVHILVKLVEEQSPTVPLVASGADVPPPAMY